MQRILPLHDNPVQINGNHVGIFCRLDSDGTDATSVCWQAIAAAKVGMLRRDKRASF